VLQYFPITLTCTDVERTLAELDHVIGFYGVSQEVEAVVRAGPGPGADAESRLEPFLAAMTKLQAAQEYFEKNNPQSVELENVVCCVFCS
jgi:exocyst complex protein 7